MSEPFVGEIRMFAGSFAPRSWAFCDGQLLAISQNDALFSLFGTIYGGDGITTFGLPDLRGRVPVHEGTGPGLSNRRLGAKGGAERVTLTLAQAPSHTHNLQPVAGSSATLRFESGASDEAAPAGNSIAVARGGEELFRTSAGAGEKMHANTVSLVGGTQNAGGSQAHTNMPPFLCVNFIVALFGIYPSRS
jgi:microcystin-dependent protein